MYSFNIRKKKLEKRIAQVFSEFLLYQVDDERLKNEYVSVTKVELNDELTRATIFFRMLNEEKKNKIIKLLYHVQPFFMTQLRKKINLRKLPEIRFINDLKYEKSAEVLRMIDDISKTMKKL